MNLKPTEVTDPEGNPVEAYIATCPENVCNNDTFRIFVIHGQNHLMCTKCNTSFCQGGNCSENSCNKD